METLLTFPSILLAGIAAGRVASRRAQRTASILSLALAPVILIPLFAGIGLYLHRLVKLQFPTSLSQEERHAALRGALTVAKHALDVGVATAGVMLGASVAALAGWLITRAHTTTDLSARNKWVKPAAVAMLAVAWLFTWMTGPLAAENRTPIPGHDHRTTQRIFPPVSVALGQAERYSHSRHASAGPYRDRLFFPLATIGQDPLFHWGPELRISTKAVTVNGIVASSRQSLQGLLATAQDNERLLRGQVHPPLIEATPYTPLRTVLDALGVIHDNGCHEVRLITGLPETIERPTLGALSRVALQTTTVVLARSGDDRPEARHSAFLSRAAQSYRELLDRVLPTERAYPPVLLLNEA